MNLAVGICQFLFVVAVIVLLLLSCAGPEALKDDGVGQSRVNIALLAGAARGGLVENNTMTGLEDESDIDAITGATSKTFTAGLHAGININGHRLETGFDYIAFDQSVRYTYPAGDYGQRDIRFQQIRLPLSYNLLFFRNERNQAALELKAGVSLGYTFSKSITDYGNVPDYRFSTWDAGPTLGLAFYPWRSASGYRAGLYMDIYRGSRIYEDRYHTAEGMGGQSYLKVGIVVQR